MNDQLWDLSEADFKLLHELPVCGCGRPGEVYEVYRGVLATAVQASNSSDDPDVDWPSMQDREAPAGGNDTLLYMAAYVLDHIEATEHGGGVLGSWATDKGRRLLALLDEYHAMDYRPTPCTSV